PRAGSRKAASRARRTSRRATGPCGDRLDAVLCLVQAAWAAERPRHGLPEGVDPVEGWIATAG
ncbi:MAG: DUF429 domain-containing protein, partial [Betaproteobacteria bacterium]